MRGTYESGPPSPRCFEKAEKAEAALAAAPVRQKYVPPGMRNNPGSASSATALLQGLRKDEGSTNIVGRVQAQQPQQPLAPQVKKPVVQRQLLVGEVPDEEEEPAKATASAAERNKKRRDKKKKKAAVAANGGNAGGDNNNNATAASGGGGDAKAEETSEPVDQEELQKKLRKLRKKLRQIESLKASGHLLPEQASKVQEEASLLKKVAALEAKIKK